MANLFESLFILALDEDEGYIVESVVEDLESALAGAVLAELVLRKRISLNENNVVADDSSPTEHPILDKALFDIAAEAKVRKLKYWINTLAYKKFLQEIGHDLVEQGVLARHKKRLLLSAPESEEQEAREPSLKFKTKEHLRAVILAGEKAELTDKVLLMFLYQADLLRLVFTVGERKAASKRIRKLLKSDEPVDTLLDAVKKIAVESSK